MTLNARIEPVASYISHAIANYSISENTISSSPLLSLPSSFSSMTPFSLPHIIDDLSSFLNSAPTFRLSLDAGDKTCSICCSYFFLLLWFTKFTLVCLYPHLPVSSIMTSIKFQPCQTMNKPFNPPLYGFPLPCTPSTFIWVLEMAGNSNNLASYLLIYARVSKLK